MYVDNILARKAWATTKLKTMANSACAAFNSAQDIMYVDNLLARALYNKK
jgi:hypothetical protein